MLFNFPLLALVTMASTMVAASPFDYPTSPIDINIQPILDDFFNDGDVADAAAEKWHIRAYPNADCTGKVLYTKSGSGPLPCMDLKPGHRRIGGIAYKLGPKHGLRANQYKQCKGVSGVLNGPREGCADMKKQGFLSWRVVVKK